MKIIKALSLVTAIFFFPTIKAQSDFNDVAEIFHAKCTNCHHDGGIAPFSLSNYTEVSSFSNSIHTSVNAGTMPPWQPDTAYTTSGKKVPHYLNANYLTFVEKTAILDWITDGVLEGDPAQSPAAPTYGDTRHRLNGKEDLNIQIPTYYSNASPDVLNPYNCFVIPSNLTEDRWLRAFEIVPGNLAAVHHVVVTIDTTNTEVTDTSGNCANQGGQFGIGGWTPGTPPTIFPSQAPLKTGIRIPAGSNFILQMHYAPGSDGLIDSTKLRLFFYPEGETGIREMHSNTLIQDWGFFGQLGAEFPANSVRTRKATTATSQIRPHAQQPTTDFSIFSVNPHSHAVCTKIKNYAYNGTDTIPLISIPNWDFNWEGNYFFPNLIKIPAGYTLESEHVFDNTVANTHLDGPPKNTRFGQGTEDEMLFDSFLYIDYQPGDENINLKAMIENDTLLYVGIEKVTQVVFKTFIAPNPTSDYINIYISAKSVYMASILNITGQTILTTNKFIEGESIDLGGVPAGIYIYLK